jgi:integrase
MPKKSAALLSTDREVAAAKPPPAGKSRAQYRIEGTPGLVLRVTRKKSEHEDNADDVGSRSWGYWLKRPKTNRWQLYTLGTYPAVTLAKARQQALALKQQVLAGIDPFDARNVDVFTFMQLGETYITRHAKAKKRSWAEDERTLRHDVFPVLGGALADKVTKSDVVRLLDRIHDRGAPIQANRTLALLRKLFNFAVAEGYLTTNPALRIPARAKEEARTRTLDVSELAVFWRALDGPRFDPVTADALKLQLLLGARVREITGMTRAELALDGSTPVWTLPKLRAKGGRDVPRPLPPEALRIIRCRLEAAGKSPFVFASPVNRSQPITARAPAHAVQRAAEPVAVFMAAFREQHGCAPSFTEVREGLPEGAWVPAGFTPHDLRRTCRTYLARLGIDETVAKKILGHAPPRADVTAHVYDQHTYLPEMRRALEAWERHLLAIVDGREEPSNVVNLRSAGGA